MPSTRRLRVIAILAVLIVVGIFGYKSASTAPEPPVVSGNKVAAVNQILNSHNNEKQDELINNEIGRLQGGLDDDELPLVADDVEEKNEEFDPAQELLNIRMVSPMVVFSKTYCPYSKRIKKLLKDNYEFAPEFAVVELDKHEHGAELQEYVRKVSGRGTVPNVLVGQLTESRGGCDDFVALHENGELLKTLNEWGLGLVLVTKKDTPSNF